MTIDPYANHDQSEWARITADLVADYPLSASELREVVLDSWDRILQTRIGDELKIGEEYVPPPQMMGNFIHNMIPVVLERRYPNTWRKDDTKDEKDLIYLPDRTYDTEIKTSSSRKIFANRSYAQPATATGKNKTGFYIAVNFESFKVSSTPEITLLRLGWLSHQDWIPQASATGQAAHLAPITYQTKLVTIYQSNNT